MAKRKKQQSAKSARPTQVGEQMRQALSTMLLEGAIKDPRVQEASIVTITDVAMTPDLKQARVYVSIFPEDKAVETEVLAGLESASGATQREVAARLQLRFTPRVRFFADESIREGAKIEALLKEIRDDDADDPTDADPIDGADPTDADPTDGADPTDADPSDGTDPTDADPTDPIRRRRAELTA